MSRKIRVFLDVSCWIAAASSSSGGSAAILKLVRAGYLGIAATREILEEAERNIKAKIGKDALLRYYQELGTTKIDMIDRPTPEERAQ